MAVRRYGFYLRVLISLTSERSERVRDVVEGLNVINVPKCNKVLNVITFGPKCNKVLNLVLTLF